MAQRTHQIAVIGGDGIGPEVVAAALEVLSALGVSLETRDFDLGAARYLRDGFVLDDATLEELRRFDAILLGAIGPALGDVRIPGGTLERGLLTAPNSRSCARIPRVPTRARAVFFAEVERTKSPRRVRSIPDSASSDVCASRLSVPHA
jgi:isocitrate dehydrogenase